MGQRRNQEKNKNFQTEKQNENRIHVKTMVCH